MYTYTFSRQNGKDFSLNVKTGFTNDMSEVKVDVIEQRSDYLHSKATYPNGFVLEQEVTSDRIILKTSHPIVLDSDGSLKFDV